MSSATTSSVIGSGPTVPDASTFGDALDILDRLRRRARYPRAVVDRLERGAPRRAVPRRRSRTIRGSHRRVAPSSAAASMRCAAPRTQPRALGYARSSDRRRRSSAKRAWPARHLVRRVCRAPATRPRPAVCHLERRNDRPRHRQRARRTQSGIRAGAPRSAWPRSACRGARQCRHRRHRRADRRRRRDRGPDTVGARAPRPGCRPGQFLARQRRLSHFSTALDDLISTGPTGTNVGDLQISVSASRPAAPTRGPCNSFTDV